MSHLPPLDVYNRLMSRAYVEGDCLVTPLVAPTKDRVPLIEWIDNGSRVSMRTSHVVWKTVHGTVENPFQLYHACGNPQCILVDHMVLSDRPPAEPYVERIQSLTAQGCSVRSIARAVGVSHTVINRLNHGESHHLTRRTAKLIDEMVIDIPEPLPEYDFISILAALLRGERPALPWGHEARLPYVEALLESGWKPHQICYALRISNTTYKSIEALMTAENRTNKTGLQIADLSNRLAEAEAEAARWMQAYTAAVAREEQWRTIALKLQEEQS